MISREFVRKYLEVKENLEKKVITVNEYKDLIIKLCVEYQIDPAELAEYNMEAVPRKFDFK